MLTTTNNPFNPFTQFNEWLGFDEAKGYYSLALLGRVVRTSEALSEADEELANEDAINIIVKENALGLHRKVYQST